MAIVTRDSLTEMLDDESLFNTMHVVGKALIVLLKNQTAEEQASNETKLSNGLGFTSADAYSGTITAKYYLSHKRIEEWQVSLWTRKNNRGVPRLAKYHAQLNIAAEAKARTDARSEYTRKKTGG